MSETSKLTDEVPEAYIPIQHAYAWVELIIDAKASDGSNAWKDINNGKRPPHKVVEIIQRLAVDLAQNRDPDEPVHNLKVMRKILVELTTPLFLTYIAGKMGAV